jgi:hypothetical protein
VCFRKRPSFINETIHYEELNDEQLLFNAKKRKRDEFEKKDYRHKKGFQEDGDSEESTASNAGKVSTMRIAVEQHRKMFK